MGVQHPVAADLALQAKLLAVGGQQQLDGRTVKADAMVETLHAVLGINALNDHHAHQDIGILDELGVAGEQGLHGVGLIGRDDEIYPAAGDIHTGQVLYDLIHLRNDDTALAGRGFHQGGGLLGAVAGKQVAVLVGLVGSHQANIGDEIHKQAGIDLQVCIKVADLHLALGKHLAESLRLRTCKGEIHRAGNALLKVIQMLAAGDGGDDHGQVVDDLGVDLRQRSRQEGRLLLIVALQHHLIAGVNDRLHQLDDIAGRYCFAAAQRSGRLQSFRLGTALIIPGHSYRTTFHFFPKKFIDLWPIKAMLR